MCRSLPRVLASLLALVATSSAYAAPVSGSAGASADPPYVHPLVQAHANVLLADNKNRPVERQQLAALLTQRGRVAMAKGILEGDDEPLHEIAHGRYRWGDDLESRARWLLEPAHPFREAVRPAPRLERQKPTLPEVRLTDTLDRSQTFLAARPGKPADVLDWKMADVVATLRQGGAALPPGLASIASTWGDRPLKDLFTEWTEKSYSYSHGFRPAQAIVAGGGHVAAWTVEKLVRQMEDAWGVEVPLDQVTGPYDRPVTLYTFLRKREAPGISWDGSELHPIALDGMKHGGIPRLVEHSLAPSEVAHVVLRGSSSLVAIGHHGEEWQINGVLDGAYKQEPLGAVYAAQKYLHALALEVPTPSDAVTK